MSYLALGIRFEDGSTNSMEVRSSDPNEVAQEMSKEFGTEFDDIFLIQNGESSPEVEYHFIRDILESNWKVHGRPS
jgi:hypothetical protein